MLRGEDMQQYFTSFLTAEQAEFMQAVLTTKAAPRKEAFPPITASTDSTSMERLIGSYLDLYLTKPLGPPGMPPQRITITRQRIPPSSDQMLDASSPADAYYSAVWQRRVSAAVEPREPHDPERVRRAPSASREFSA